jgi:hypothetical protein
MSNSTLPTPDRQTAVFIQAETTSLAQPEWEFTRTGLEIMQGGLSNKALPFRNVHLTKAGYITLTPSLDNMLVYVTREGSPSVIGGGDINAPPDLKEKIMYGPNSLISGPVRGILKSPDLIASGGKALIRKIRKDGRYDNQLDADAAAIPSPTDDRDEVNQVRIIQVKQTHKENTGYVIMFDLHEEYFNFHNLIKFQFGGGTGTDPDTASGGRFCLVLAGNGHAKLYEYDEKAKKWELRYEFKWAEVTKIMGRVHVIRVMPYCASYIDFDSISPEADSVFNIFRDDVNNNNQMYFESSARSGHTHTKWMTGLGVPRVDVRADYRRPLSIARLVYIGDSDHDGITDGNCYDVPFHIPFTDINGDWTRIKLYIDAHLGDDNSIEATVCRADTLAPLTLSAGNLDAEYTEWVAEDNVQDYIVKFKLLTEDKYATPVLKNYKIVVTGLYLNFPNTTTSTQPYGHVSATGPSIADPRTSSAKTQIHDPANQFSILKSRGRIRSSILVNSSGGTIGFVHDGETARVKAKRVGRRKNRGFAGAGGLRQYPSTNWFDYDISMVGMWSRLADQRFIGLKNFYIDPSRPRNPRTGELLPWKITDIIYYLIRNAGFPDNQIGLPDLPTRLWQSPGLQSDDYYIATGASHLDVIQKLAKDILGMALCWDPSISLATGVYGAWRLIPNPNPPYAPQALYNFYSQRPTWGDGVPRVVHNLGGYGTNGSWIQDFTFEISVEPPEFNYIAVSTDGRVLPGTNAGNYQYFQALYNKDSISNPDSPDFLGRWVPLFHVDRYLGSTDPAQSQLAVDLVCVRYFDQAAHARFWVNYHAPLIWLAPSDTPDQYQYYHRMLRLNDVVLLDGVPILLHSVTPSYEYDGIQMADYEGIIVPE